MQAALVAARAAAVAAASRRLAQNTEAQASASRAASSLATSTPYAAPVITSSAAVSTSHAQPCKCCFGAVHRMKHNQHGRFFSSASASESVVQLILNDHRKAEQLFEKYHAAREAAAKQKHAWALIKEISQHGAKEEMSIYPWMKQHFPETSGVVSHGIKEHQRLKEDLAALDKITVDDPRFDQTIQRVWKDLTHHIKEEESTILPQLEKKATAAELVKLGETFQQVEAIAPTRPHPHAPAEGVAAVVANAGAKIVDSMRDAKRNQEAKKQ